MNRLLWVCLWITLFSTFAADKPTQLLSINYRQEPLVFILEDYKMVTGKEVSFPNAIRAIPFTFECTDLDSDLLTATLWKQLIERALLLNGFHLTETADGQMSVVEWGKPPLTVPYVNPEDMPDGDFVVSYLMSLKYLSVAEALQIFTPVVASDVNHPDRSIKAIPQSNSLLIVANSRTIEQLVTLQRRIDLGDSSITTKVFQCSGHDILEVAVAVGKHTESWPRSVVVYPDIRTSRLIVRAENPEMIAIQKFLTTHFGASAEGD